MIWARPGLLANVASTSERLNDRRWLPFRSSCRFCRQAASAFWIPAPGWYPGEGDHVVPRSPVPRGRHWDQLLRHQRSLSRSSPPTDTHSRRVPHEGSFVDLEAVRYRPQGIQGIEPILFEAYEALSHACRGDRRYTWATGLRSKFAGRRRCGVV